jgi:hypothetical protein
MKTEFQLKELSPQSRYSIHTAPPKAPGKCFICSTGGGVDERKFLDFGKQLKWYGAVYFCSECIREIAEALGYYPAEIFKLLTEANSELIQANDQLRKSLESANVARRAIAGTLANCTCGPDGPYPDDAEDVESDSRAESDDQEPIKFDGLEGFVGIRGTGDDD